MGPWPVSPCPTPGLKGMHRAGPGSGRGQAPLGAARMSVPAGSPMSNEKPGKTGRGWR
jgi:hypothetical protein